MKFILLLILCCLLGLAAVHDFVTRDWAAAVADSITAIFFLALASVFR